MKMHLEQSHAKWWPFCTGGDWSIYIIMVFYSLRIRRSRYTELNSPYSPLKKQEPVHLAMIRIASQRWSANTVILKDMNDTGRYLAKIRQRKTKTTFILLQRILAPVWEELRCSWSRTVSWSNMFLVVFFINVCHLWFVYFGKNCLFLMWIMDCLMCCQVRIQLKTYVGLMIIAVYNTKGLLK